MNHKRKKRFVEIYFILYLAALVLLIPGKRDNELADEDEKSRPGIYQIPFSLKPEKNSLTASLRLDSNGITMISIDSVNIIYYTGLVKDVRYDVSIEDIGTRQILTIDKQQFGDNDFFRYTSNESTRSLKFYWSPPIYDKRSRTYNVKISASAVSTEPETQGFIVEDQIQFSLNLNLISDFTNNYFIASDTSTGSEEQSLSGSIIDERTLMLSRTNLFLTPREEIVRTIAYSSWENEVIIAGLDPKIDLRKQPEIKLIKEPNDKIGGNARIAGITNDGLIIRGETPGYGSMKVKVSIVRHADGREVSREFRVQPQLIEEPKFQRTLYPDYKYVFEPRLPILSGQKTSAILKSSDGQIYASTESGAEFSFTPSINDTGKILLFERYVDNHLIGQSNSVRVSMYPIPEISRISEVGQNTLRIITNSYGKYRGRENYISKIEVLQGNAKVREIIGGQRNQEGALLIKQTFEITPANGSSEFAFKIQAVTVNGQKSEVMSYPKK